MPQLRLYTLTFFFILLSTVFGINICSERNHCHRRICGSTNGTAVPVPTAVGDVVSHTATQTPPSNTPNPMSSNSVPHATPSSAAVDTSANNIQAYLTAHNSVRTQHGAVPLTWSANLAGKAQQWANGCKFEHSGDTLGKFGENIAAGPGLSILAAIKLWTDEVSEYDPKNPVPSHFTQVVWKATTQVGCAVQACNFHDHEGLSNYYVCEYSAEGNVIGEFSQNVQA